VTLGIYCPSLDRHHALARLQENIRSTTTVPYRLVIVAEPYDQLTFSTARQLGLDAVFNTGQSSYTDAIQTAYDTYTDPVFLLANDDFDFQPGWDTAALAAMTGPIKVVGVDDGSPTNRFSAIHVVARDYIETQSGVVDRPGRVLGPYHHNFVDVEMWETSKARGVFAEAPGSVIRHKHPDWGHAAQDDTYRKNQATFTQDAKLFKARRPLWTT
jgi:hypothetical protein